MRVRVWNLSDNEESVELTLVPPQGYDASQFSRKSFRVPAHGSIETSWPVKILSRICPGRTQVFTVTGNWSKSPAIYPAAVTLVATAPLEDILKSFLWKERMPIQDMKYWEANNGEGVQFEMHITPQKHWVSKATFKRVNFYFPFMKIPSNVDLEKCQGMVVRAKASFINSSAPASEISIMVWEKKTASGLVNAGSGAAYETYGGSSMITNDDQWYTVYIPFEAGNFFSQMTVGWPDGKNVSQIGFGKGGGEKGSTSIIEISDLYLVGAENNRN
jgi:hypothetical protein